MNKVQKFNSFLNSMKKYNPSLIESIQEGFKVCFENFTDGWDVSRWLNSLVDKYVKEAYNFFIEKNFYDENDVNKQASDKVRSCIYNILHIIYDDYTDTRPSDMHEEVQKGIVNKFELALNYIKHIIDDSIQLDSIEFANSMYQYDRYERTNKLKQAIKVSQYTDKDGYIEGNEDGTAPYLDNY